MSTERLRYEMDSGEYEEHLSSLEARREMDVD